MFITVIPGQTGCLACRDVPQSKRKSIKALKVNSVEKPPTNNGCICGHTLVKSLLTIGEEEHKSDRHYRNAKAKNATQHKLGRPTRISIRHLLDTSFA